MDNELPKIKIDERTGIEYHLEGQSQTRCFRSLAEVTKGVPSPARARALG